MWEHYLGFLEDLTSCGGALFGTSGGLNVVVGLFWLLLMDFEGYLSHFYGFEDGLKLLGGGCKSSTDVE